MKCINLKFSLKLADLTIFEYLILRKKERKKNVNAHNYGQWIGMEKDLSVIEPHTIYFITIFEQF